MQARKDDGFALLIVYIAAFGKYGAVSEKSLKNRRRAIFRQQRHFQTQDSDVSDACCDGGNGRVSKPKQLMMKYPLQHQTAKFGIFLKNAVKKRILSFRTNGFRKSAQCLRKSRRIITNSQINHKSEDILISVDANKINRIMPIKPSKAAFFHFLFAKAVFCE